MNPILEKMLRGIVGQKIGSYRLNKFIGVGGFGGVFQASEMVRNTPIKEIALKIIPESSDEQLQELLNARELEHPYLIRSYNVGECEFFDTEMLYLAMELASSSLDQKITTGKLTTDTVKNITTQVASGLAFLHENNRVHRDLKPANILSVNQQWKLSDFGLIRQLNNSSYTETINIGGTIIYMPPEAFDGEISPASDIWSLGVMLVEMLTGQLPYDFDNNNQKLTGQVMRGNIKIPSLPSEFKPIVEGCLQKDRKQRWTASQVLNALSGKQSPVISLNQGKDFVEDLDLANGVKLEMVYIPAGSFMMGANSREEGALSSEYPQHRVNLKAFYMAKYPITQAQYKAIIGGQNPSHFKGNNRPVDSVSWNMAQLFCQQLSKNTGKIYQLPSEAQWEYACRAGTTTPFYFGQTLRDNLANYNATETYGNGTKGKYRKETTPVGSFPPNGFGLYDMHGNVWEWCADTWHDNYKNAPIDGSAWVDKSSNIFVVRGGSWYSLPTRCRSARRECYKQEIISNLIGFRVIYQG